MKEYAFCIDLKNNKELIKKYKDYHANPWPEVVEALKKVGVKKMNIYLLGRRLFMVLEGKEDFDIRKNLPNYLKLHPRCQEWEDLMGTLQESVAEANEKEKWTLMERIFEL